MRISTLQSFNSGLQAMQRINASLRKTQANIASGKKFNTPADDPVAATRILQLNQDIAIREQYRKNITLVTNRLSLEESILNGVGELLQRVRELTLQAGNGSLNATDRKFIGAEVRIRLDELLGMLNSKDPNGEYIFSGYKGDTIPFVDGGSGGYQFQGDEGERMLQIAASTFIQQKDSGKHIFVEVAAADNTFFTSASPRNSAVPAAAITVGQVLDQQLFDQFYPQDAYIEFQPIDDISPPGGNFTVRRRSDNRVLDGLVNEPFVEGAAIIFSGISVRITGNPDPGDSFAVESSNKQNVLTTLARLVDGLDISEDTAAGRARMANLIDTTLQNLDNAQTSMLEARSRIGGRLNTLDSIQALHEDVDGASKAVLSQLQDLDYADALSRLSLQSFILEAAQLSFVKIANLSLFSKL